MALPSASTVSTGAGVLALGVATLVGFVVLAMLAEEGVFRRATKTPIYPSDSSSTALVPGDML